MATLPLAAARQLVVDRLAEDDADGALALARQIQQRLPSDRWTSLLAARAHRARGDLAEARAELDRVSAAFPDQREAWSELAACGASETAAAMLADLPPLPAVNGERPPISAVALGHLYLRQLLLTHCTAQLGPVWRADTSRLDVGVALAEAHWRLGEVAIAEDICRAVLAVAPECLKANLILAQQLCSSGRREDAASLLNAAEAVDPENVTAEELYEWLTVRDRGLAPLHKREVQIDLAESGETEAALESAAPETEAQPELRVREELTGIGGLLGGIEVLQEPVPEPEPFWEHHPSTATAPDSTPVEPASSPLEPSPSPEMAEPPATEPLDMVEVTAEPEPITQSDAAVASPSEIAEGSQEPAAAGAEPEQDAAMEPAAPAEFAASGEPESSHSEPVAPVQPWIDLAGAAEEPVPAPEPIPADAVHEVAEPPPAPDVALTSPEPALAAAETGPAIGLRWLEVSPRGHLSEVKTPSIHAAVPAWIVVCDRAGERLGLGAVHASSIESARGAVQIQHEPGAATVALAPSGANLGLVRASLRRSQQPSEEHTGS